MEENIIQKTKDIIFQAAKKEFYEKGYIKGTLKNIAVIADVPQGLVTYYFRTKDNLVAEIFKDFYKSIIKLIESYEELNITNSLYKQIVTSHIYYAIILGDIYNKRIFREVREKKSSNYHMLQEVTDEVYWGYLDDFHLSISKIDFRILMIMHSAARRDFFLYYFEEKWDMSNTEIVNIVEGIVPRLFRIDQDVVDRYLFQGQNIVKDIDYSGIKFLI